MAHETIKYSDRITRDPDVLVGKPRIKGTRILVEQVLAGLATDPDVAVLIRAYPELTRDDVRAALAYARDRLRAEDAAPQVADEVSPQQFYAEITQRPDVSELLRRLAR